VIAVDVLIVTNAGIQWKWYIYMYCTCLCKGCLFAEAILAAKCAASVLKMYP